MSLFELYAAVGAPVLLFVVCAGLAYHATHSHS